MKKIVYVGIIAVIIIIIIICMWYYNGNIKFNFILDNNYKLKIYDNCKFSGYGFDDNWEIGECSIANQVIPYCKNVLEIGGGTGKVSHIINQILKKKKERIQTFSIRTK